MPVETEGGRWNQCCPVVGWLDPETVLFESRHEEARILAWRVGTEDPLPGLRHPRLDAGGRSRTSPASRT